MDATVCDQMGSENQMSDLALFLVGWQGYPGCTIYFASKSSDTTIWLTRGVVVYILFGVFGGGHSQNSLGFI